MKKKKKKLNQAKERLKEIQQLLWKGTQIAVLLDEGVALITSMSYDKTWGVGVYVQLTNSAYKEWIEDWDEIDSEEFEERVRCIQRNVAKAVAKLLKFDDYAWRDEDIGISVFSDPPIRSLK